MSYLLTLFARKDLTLASTSFVLPPDQIESFQDAESLVERLTALLAGQQSLLDEAQEQARREGEAAGYEAGRSKALDDAAKTLADNMTQIAAEQAAQREELREALVALAGAMVRRMAAELAPAGVLAALAERAFEHVIPPQPVRLRLPLDLVEPVRAQLAQRELAMPVQCVPDEELSGLQCIVESAAGVLLAGLDDVLDRTKQALETASRTQNAGAFAEQGIAS